MSRHEELPKQNNRRRIAIKELEDFVKRNQSTESLARHYTVSERTITRWIKTHDLLGLRPKGRKPRARRVRRSGGN